MKQTSLKMLTVALLATASSVAAAQTMSGQSGMQGAQPMAPGQQRMSQQPMTGAMQGSPGTPMTREYRMSPDVQAQLRQRRGPEQRQQELVQTTLLNQFGQLGFSELRSMRKQGENYVAEVTTNTGEPAVVIIDPDAGTMRSQMAATGTTGSVTGSTGAGAAGGAMGSGSTMGTMPMRQGTMGNTGSAGSAGAMGGTAGAGTTTMDRTMNQGGMSAPSNRAMDMGRQDSTLSPMGSPAPLTGQSQSTMGDRTGSGTTPTGQGGGGAIR